MNAQNENANENETDKKESLLLNETKMNYLSSSLTNNSITDFSNKINYNVRATNITTVSSIAPAINDNK